jgi:CRP-like cAMP-binding protein
LASHSTSAPSSRNRLLSALPPEDLARLWPRLEPVELVQRAVLHPAETPVTAVYFPETGYASILAQLEDGDSAEVGLIGPEGVVGMAALLTGDTDTLESMVQGAGGALRLGTAALREEMERMPAFRTLLHRFVLVHHGQVARTAACNGRHLTDQRLARWLLMAHDRSEGDTFPMTHEFLAMMLGLRRAGVTVAAGQLQKAGFIRYERGSITITDRPGLESAACECYGVVRRAQDRLLGAAGNGRTPYRA